MKLTSSTLALSKATSYGAFVDIGGVDGLCHISELSWNNIKHPSEVVSVGDTIEVYVKSYDPENQKVSLGYKKEEDNPWEKLKNEYPIGSEFEAPVVSITKFGAFVRILPGIDGPGPHQRDQQRAREQGFRRSEGRRHGQG